MHYYAFYTHRWRAFKFRKVISKLKRRLVYMQFGSVLDNPTYKKGNKMLKYLTTLITILCFFSVHSQTNATDTIKHLEINRGNLENINSSHPNIETLSFQYVDLNKATFNISNFSSVINLMVQGSSLDNNIFNGLCKLNMLEHILLENSKLKGDINDLLRNKKVRILFLERAEINGIKELKLNKESVDAVSFSELKNISIDDIENIVDSSSIIALSIYSIKKERKKSFKRTYLADLERLILEWTKIKSIDLENCLIIPNLNYLSLSSNKLEKIYFDQNSLLNINYLDLSFNNFQDFPQEILEMKNIKKLFLMGNPLNDVPEGISNLEKLEELSLPFRITKERIEELKAKLPNCKIYQTPFKPRGRYL